MNEPTTKPRRKLTSLELSAPARGALRRIKRAAKISYTGAIERGLVLLEKSLVIGEPMLPPERTALALLNTPRPQNRRKVKVAK